MLAARCAHGAALVADRPLDALLTGIEPTLGTAVVSAAPANDAAAAMAPSALCATFRSAGAAMSATVALGMGGAAMAATAALILARGGHGDAESGDAGEKQKFTHDGSPNPTSQRPAGR